MPPYGHYTVQFCLKTWFVVIQQREYRTHLTLFFHLIGRKVCPGAFYLGVAHIAVKGLFHIHLPVVHQLFLVIKRGFGKHIGGELIIPYRYAVRLFQRSDAPHLRISPHRVEIFPQHVQSRHTVSNG